MWKPGENGEGMTIGDGEFGLTPRGEVCIRMGQILGNRGWGAVTRYSIHQYRPSSAGVFLLFPESMRLMLNIKIGKEVESRHLGIQNRDRNLNAQ